MLRLLRIDAIEIGDRFSVEVHISLFFLFAQFTSYINSLVIVEMYDRALFKGKLINITKDIVTLHDDADILIPISTILNIYVID